MYQRGRREGGEREERGRREGKRGKKREEEGGRGRKREEEGEEVKSLTALDVGIAILWFIIRSNARLH